MASRPTFGIEIVEGLTARPSAGKLVPDDIIIAMVRPEEAADAVTQAMLMEMLSDDEKQRLSRFRFETDRLLFLVAHGLVRIALSRHENVEPRTWRFRMGSHGRPEISEPGSRLRFNLSRTRGLAACAVTLDRDIGLDVEDVSSDVPIEIAERFFSETERARLLAAPTDARAGLFLEYWTLKEAYIKARGLGLSLPLDKLTFDRGNDGQWRLVSDSPQADDPERWRFWSFLLAEDHRIALAIDQGPVSVVR